MKTKLNSLKLLSLTIGVVYLWFGALKFIPGLSPAEVLAKNTIDTLTVGLLPAYVTVPLLAVVEVLIGVLLLSGLFKKQAILIALIHMAFTFTPLIFFPTESFQIAPLVPTLVGQYIGKNIIIIGALVVIYRHETGYGKIINQN